MILKIRGLFYVLYSPLSKQNIHEETEKATKAQAFDGYVPR